MIAYKVFNADWTCRGFKYEVGKTYSIKSEPIMCERGFHACKKVADCFHYYSFDPNNKVAEVELLGIVLGEDSDKQCASKITIIKELTWGEMLVMANSGNGNTGHRNSGDSNSGDSNSGDSNSGDRNSGDSNSGDWNSGHSNSGDRNSGDRNSGDWNSGDWNSGDRNSGHRNSGDWNSGDWNSGDRNSGHSNSGDRNSGHRNSGHRNSGDWNSGHSNSGYFNSTTPNDVLVFNKKCKRQIWEDATKPDFIYNIVTCEWIPFSYMADEEKKNDPNAFVRDGYLKKYDYKEAWKNAFDKASEADIELLKRLPNFDADVFFEISGIRL
jgi:hypothetical protein